MGKVMDKMKNNYNALPVPQVQTKFFLSTMHHLVISDKFWRISSQFLHFPNFRYGTSNNEEKS